MRIMSAVQDRAFVLQALEAQPITEVSGPAKCAWCHASQPPKGWLRMANDYAESRPVMVMVDNKT